MSLGSKNGYLAKSDEVDLPFMMVAFESMNNVRLAVTIMACDTDGVADLQLSMVALPRMVADGEVTPLASANRRYSAMNLKTLYSALIQLMYVLDFQLAEKELGRARKE